MIFPEVYKRKRNPVRWYFKQLREDKWVISWQSRHGWPIYERYILFIKPATFDLNQYIIYNLWTDDVWWFYLNNRENHKSILSQIKTYYNYEQENFKYILHGMKKENV